MSVRDQNWKPQNFTRDAQAYANPVVRSVPTYTDVNYDMVTRWISLADQALRNSWDRHQEG
jgi:hypothetical protein